MFSLKKTIALLCLLPFSLSSSIGQITSLTGDFTSIINTEISALPSSGGDDLILPTASELNTWGTILQALLDGQYQTASDSAEVIDYELIHFTDNTFTPSRVFYILRNTGTNYWGTYVYNPNFLRPLFIESPHPWRDLNTGKQGAFVFEQSEAMFFGMSGTHRCNSPTQSPCSGTSGSCNGGVNIPYTISDPAHVLGTFFQSTTDTIFNRYDFTYFIQLHGFTKGTNDPFVILSNGTTSTPAVDYFGALRSNLEAEDPLFVDSIKVAHLDNYTKLLGSTNVQGRLINGSANQCTSSASSSSGRFFHIEQEKTRLRDTQAGWTKMSNAIMNTFPPLVLSTYRNDIWAEAKESLIQIEWQGAMQEGRWLLEKSLDGRVWIPLQELTIKRANQSFSFLDKPKSKTSHYYRATWFGPEHQSLQTKVVSARIGSASKISIHPNPASFELRITGLTEDASFSLYSSIGQNVEPKISREWDGENWILDVSTLPHGLYLFHSEGDAEWIVIGFE